MKRAKSKSKEQKPHSHVEVVETPKETTLDDDEWSLGPEQMHPVHGVPHGIIRHLFYVIVQKIYSSIVYCLNVQFYYQFIHHTV
jgi:hypothetical protein